jgi:endoglucanase
MADLIVFFLTVQFVDSTTKAGAYAMICPHNYGRYYGQVISDPNSFKAYWATVAAAFKDNPRVIWDTNNECKNLEQPSGADDVDHTMDQGLVVRLNQAAIDGIRSTGAKQPIHVEGNHWSGAWTWTKTRFQNAGETNAQSMLRLKDPQNQLVYHMHQYLDTDGSGTHKECVSSTIGTERLREATAWLKKNKKVGFIGEFAAGDNAKCKTAIEGMLRYMQQNSDVWKGWAWWSAGPWWGPYMYSLEPKDGQAYKPYIDLIMKYR